jgi:hypothetical protein
MANADFENRNSAAGGFSAGSYQADAPRARSLTPAQQKLAALEQKLPAALKNSAAALAVLILVAAVGIFGIGGAKLHSRYAAVQSAITTGAADDTSYGGDYTVAAQLSARAAAAQSVVSAGSEQLGADDSYVTAAQQALDAATAAYAGADASSLADVYDADAALEAALDALYAQMQAAAADPMKMGAAQTAYSSFNSAGRIVSNLSYNALAQSYNEAASGFPANVIGALWGCGKAELFA